ncbi:type II toxin-antitoxin system VapC family toxin [soil metagenome]
MVIDASALIAFLEDEPYAGEVLHALLHAERLLISTATVVEAGIVAETRRGESGGRELDLLLHRLGAEQVPVSSEHTDLARAAYRKFGRGHHPARLNFGDCFGYALAKATGDPLLFVGDDFARTDIPAAVGR